MRMNVIGLGSTAKHWKGEGPSIGVNDASSWGYDLSYLLLLNTPNQFTPERIEVIRATKCNKVYTNTPDTWEKIITDKPIIRFDSRQWSHSNKLQKISTNYLYHSKTSPFGALSLAFCWGFKDVVMWGVDMVDHRTYHPGTGSFINEHASFKTFCQSLKAAGCNVYLGHEGSTLNFLPVWK